MVLKTQRNGIKSAHQACATEPNDIKKMNEEGTRSNYPSAHFTNTQLNTPLNIFAYSRQSPSLRWQCIRATKLAMLPGGLKCQHQYLSHHLCDTLCLEQYTMTRYSAASCWDLMCVPAPATACASAASRLLPTRPLPLLPLPTTLYPGSAGR